MQSCEMCRWCAGVLGVEVRGGWRYCGRDGAVDAEVRGMHLCWVID